jgi:hypothetical protein
LAISVQLIPDRIIEIEWSVKNNTVFKPSPRKPRKTKTRRKTNAITLESDAEDEGADMDEVAQQLRENRAKLRTIREAKEFGMEITNVDSPVKSKRPYSPVKHDAIRGEADTAETPLKKRKTGGGKLMMMENSDDEDNEYVPPGHSPRKVGRAILA